VGRGRLLEGMPSNGLDRLTKLALEQIPTPAWEYHDTVIFPYTSGQQQNRTVLYFSDIREM
jgi:hypothetical protein